jgi:hypothetical protein
MQVKRYSMDFIIRHMRLLSTPSEFPFIITKHGKTVCAVVDPNAVKHVCEACGEVTENSKSFYDKKLSRYRRLVLCDRCEDDLLHDI